MGIKRIEHMAAQPTNTVKYQHTAIPADNVPSSIWNRAAVRKKRVYSRRPTTATAMMAVVMAHAAMLGWRVSPPCRCLPGGGSAMYTGEAILGSLSRRTSEGNTKDSEGHWLFTNPPIYYTQMPNRNNPVHPCRHRATVAVKCRSAPFRSGRPSLLSTSGLSWLTVGSARLCRISGPTVSAWRRP